MASAYFEYYFDVSNWINGVQEVVVGEPPVDSFRTEIIPCYKEEERHEIPVRLELFLSGVTSYEQARDAAGEFAEKVIIAATFVADLPIHHLYFNRGVFDGHKQEGHGRIGGFSNIVTSRPGERQTVPQIATDLETHLRRLDGPAESYYSMFRVAMQTYGIGRYLLLYLILLTHFGDSQSRLDAFIRQEEPGVPETPNPIRAGAKETIYTRLRNEISHLRLGTSQIATRNEIEQLTPSLILLVKKMMTSI